MIDVSPVDRKGNPYRTIDGGILRVADDRLPYLDGLFNARPLVERFKNAAGSDDLRVDGSATPVWFSIAAEAHSTKFIKSIQIFIQDTGASLGEFGNLSPLTNGVRWEYFSDENGTETIADNLQTNLDLVRLSGGFPALGSGSAAFKADVAASGGGDAYLPFIDFSMVYGYPSGLPIRQGSNDRISFVINDDLSTGINAFNIQAAGLKRDLSKL